MKPLPSLYTDLEATSSPVKVAFQMSLKMIEWDRDLTDGERSAHYLFYLEKIEELSRFCDCLHIRLDFPGLTHDKLKNIHRIMEFFRDLNTSISKQNPNHERISKKQQQVTDVLYLPGLMKSDHQMIQKKINEIRDLFRESRQIPNFRKCLCKLEALQREFNKEKDDTLSLKNYLD